MVIPDRGDLIFTGAGKITDKKLWLVLSPKIYNEATGFAMICPVTDERKGYPFEVVLTEKSALGGVVLADQIGTIDWKRLDVTPGGRVSGKTVDECLAKLHAILI